MDRRGDSAPRAGISTPRKKEILIPFSIEAFFGRRLHLVLIAAILGGSTFFLHYTIERRFNKLGVFKQHNIIFDADPQRSLNGFSDGDRGGNSSFVHPNLVYFVYPPVRALAEILHHSGLADDKLRLLRFKIALLVVPVAAGVTSVVVFAFFCLLRLAVVPTLLIALLSSVSFSQLVFGSIPDHLTLGGLAIALAYLVAVRSMNERKELSDRASNKGASADTRNDKVEPPAGFRWRTSQHISSTRIPLYREKCSWIEWLVVGCVITGITVSNIFVVATLIWVCLDFMYRNWKRATWQTMLFAFSILALTYSSSYLLARYYGDRAKDVGNLSGWIKGYFKRDVLKSACLFPAALANAVAPTEIDKILRVDKEAPSVQETKDKNARSKAVNVVLRRRKNISLKNVKVRKSGEWRVAEKTSLIAKKERFEKLRTKKGIITEQKPRTNIRYGFTLEGLKFASPISSLRGLLFAFLLAVGTFVGFGAGGIRRGLTVASVIIVGCNWILHSIWGSEFFLYSQHWLFASMFLFSQVFLFRRRYSFVFACLLALTVVAVGTNNALILSQMFSALK
jgi:hypothetical protein